jgi:4-hydroxybenzoate polyprenyltransferase
MYNLWQSKPWWCQPWTIILTGIIIIAGSWLLLHSLWFTLPVSVLIVLWWIYFLILVPRYLQQQVELDAIDELSNK